MLLAILVLAGMGSLLCVLWTGQIRDFKELNAAKFEVLNTMAPLIRFEGNDKLASSLPFTREWEILKERQATREVATINIMALRSSNAEFLVPFAFRWLFLLIFASAIVTMVVNWTTLTSSIFELKQSAPAATSPGAQNRPVGQP